MRREGRQRGMIRTLPASSGSRRTLNEISGLPTAGLFTRAPSKPTNHSKFTGKCARPRCRDCHIEPACKSKDKAKGAHKVRSPSSEQGPRVSGHSATGVLDYLNGDGGGDFGAEGYDDYDQGLCYGNKLSFGDIVDIAVDGHDDRLSFCDAVFVFGSMDGAEEGWCWVEDLL